MNIAIISDIHDNLANLDKVLKYAQNNDISEIICLGDVTSDDTLRYLAKEFTGTIHLVLGNIDFFDINYAKTFKNIIYYGEIAKINIAGKKIAFTHQPDHLKDLTTNPEFDYLFFGHTHQPWQETKSKPQLLNPGTVAGTHSRATFAVWNTDMELFQLILLDNIN